MSQLKLETKEEIRNFFKILAEESVSMAHQDLKGLSRQQEKDAKAYKSIKQEQDEVEEESEDFVLDATDEPEGVSVEDEEVKVTSPSETRIEDVSLDSIEDKLNDIRAGRSLKDSQVEAGMRAYFDELSDPERLALYAFVDTLASVMTLSGDTKDPSDPPYNVQMTTGDSSDDEVEEVEDAVVQDEEPAEVDVVVDTEEDEDVPIQVGSVQNISEIRKRVRELMGK